MDQLTQRFIKAKQALFDRLYASLNEQQRQAVYAVEGPLLVLAGAGSGKTTVLVKRIAHIIRYGNAYSDATRPAWVGEEEISALEAALSAPTEEIASLLEKYACRPVPSWVMLSITFTNKAAGEMKERLARELGLEPEQLEVWAGTFHSICVRILRRYGERIGLARSFTIYDTDDSKKLISGVLKELRIDEKMFPPKALMNAISKAKDKLTTPEEFLTLAGKDYRLSQVGKIYKRYQEKLAEADAVDFDDIIMRTVQLLTAEEEVRDYYQNRFRYVSVDEYQDTNYAQFMLSALLSGKYRNLMVVGDDDQSIYRFRGATVENILNFDKHFPDARMIKLEQNYRSTKMILDAANAVIRNNDKRHGKTLWTDKPGGELISLTELDNQTEEAVYISEQILQLMRTEHRKFSDFAVLYRMNAQSGTIEKVMTKSGIPYRVLGGTRFYDRKEIKDILSYLCLINNPNDNLRLKRIINEPKRKIGNVTIDTVEDLAIGENRSMLEVIQNASSYPVLSKIAAKLLPFGQLIADLSALASTVPLSELFRQTIERSGYRDMLVAEGEEGKERLANVEELVNNAVEYEEANGEATLSGFLEEVALVSDVDNYDKEADAVVMMTMHSAKGLEFPVVFLPGLENGMFPSMQSQTDPEEMAEERRLAYVAITRARERLYLTHARERLYYGKTQYNPVSCFVKEIPTECLNEQEKKLARPFQVPKRQDFYNNDRLTAAGSTATSRSKPKEPAEFMPVGTSVEHPTFGRGIVMSARNLGSDVLYEVTFDQVGTKKLMGNMARLKKVE